MDVVSELPTQQVRDYLFVFSNGQRTTLTIKDGDTIEEQPGAFVACTTTPEGVEDTIYFKAQMLSYSVRERTEIIYPKGESPAEKEMARLLKEADERAEALQRRRHPAARNRVKEPDHAGN